MKSSPGNVVHHHSQAKEQPLKIQFSGLKLDFISLPEPKVRKPRGEEEGRVGRKEICYGF